MSSLRLEPTMCLTRSPRLMKSGYSFQRLSLQYAAICAIRGHRAGLRAPMRFEPRSVADFVDFRCQAGEWLHHHNQQKSGRKG